MKLLKVKQGGKVVRVKLEVYCETRQCNKKRSKSCQASFFSHIVAEKFPVLAFRLQDVYRIDSHNT